MKVFTIEIAEAIEKEFVEFLKDWGGTGKARFTRFIDLGGKQTDLYMYPATPLAQPWMVIRIKSVFKTDEGECMQYFVNVPSLSKAMDDVLVSPEVWKLPALADKILTFVKNDLLVMINSQGDALESGPDDSLASSGSNQLGSGSQDDDEELDDLDTAGILAGDGDSSPPDFNPEDIINAAMSEGDSDSGFNPEDIIKEANDDSDSGFNPEDVIKDSNEDGGDDMGFNPEDVIKD